MTPRPAHTYRGARRNQDVGPDAKLRRFRNRLVLEQGAEYRRPLTGPERSYRRPTVGPRSSWPGALKPHLSPGSIYRTQFS